MEYCNSSHPYILWPVAKCELHVYHLDGLHDAKKEQTRGSFGPKSIPYVTASTLADDRKSQTLVSCSAGARSNQPLGF